MSIRTWTIILYRELKDVSLPCYLPYGRNEVTIKFYIMRDIQ